MFLVLPIELYLVIRSYLVEFQIDDGSDAVSGIIRKEAERSWRSFLVVNRAHSLIRKETMIWSLNRMTLKKYSKDEQFRQRLNDRMVNPAQQLRVTCKRSFGIESDFLLELIGSSNIACFSLYGDPQLTELPSSSRLQVLSLSRCQSVKQIGDYPNLKTLRLSDCSALERIGKLEDLLNLTLGVFGSNSVLPLEQLLSQFPLEQIQKLKLGEINESFFTLSSRLTDLKYLRLSQHYLNPMTFPGELFPSLIELHAYDFSSIQLTGMTQLRKLSIENTPCSHIVGKEEICPQLKSFSYSCYGNSVLDDSYLWVLKNATRLSLHSQQTNTVLQSDFLESLSVNVTSLNISVYGNELTIPDRFFEMVRLHDCRLSSYSSFSKVQILTLNDCYLIRDISPFKDIPYVELIQLSGVRDFSCLGSQRYLKVDDCPGLSNEAMRRFGNVFQLCISNCYNITEVSNLLGNNRFLTLESCCALKSVELSNEDYIHVTINRINLDNFNILGSVYSLDFNLNERWTKETIPRKYQYLNGEEISE
jgi:hypothetical protein